ncbi:MAG: class II aldolase/adducin family protein [Chloroflexota bacterium]
MTLQQLTHLTRTLGEPARDYVIVGEGNTSMRIDEDSFYVKASGQRMETITEAGFVAVRFEPILALFDDPPQTRTELKARMMTARVDQSTEVVPSVETSFHAMLLHDTGAAFVGHTHPTPVNQLLANNHAQTFAEKRLFPDHAVLCGPESVFVPYVDPGLPLAQAIRERVRAYMDKHGAAPHEILMANHGTIALGQSVDEILNVTAMSVKAAKIMVGALSTGQPNYMSPEDVMHIYKRPDEIYRRSRFVSGE